MRVLVVCDWFLKYATSQSEALRRAGVDVFLLCRDHAFEFGGSSEERQDVFRSVGDGVALGVLPGRITSPSAAKYIGRLRGLIRSWRPDVVHAHENTDPRLLAIVSGLTRVTTVHDPVPHPGQPSRPKLEELVRRCWIRGSAATVVHGTAIAEALPAWACRNRVAVIPHGALVRDRPLLVPSRPSVLLFGRLEPYKGVNVLLRTMQRVWAERRDVKLIVAGRGPAAALVPVHPLIELRDEYFPEAELDTLLGKATIAVLPYTEASHTGVGTTALGRGVPTIVSDVGALSDIALDSSFLVPPGDEDALARAILRHLDHGDDLRHSVLAFARERFSWDACARQSIELYESLLVGDRA
jgi:glycosyltransferase involved in cell wall biosynthesis